MNIIVKYNENYRYCIIDLHKPIFLIQSLLGNRSFVIMNDIQK